MVVFRASRVGVGWGDLVFRRGFRGSELGHEPLTGPFYSILLDFGEKLATSREVGSPQGEAHGPGRQILLGTCCPLSKGCNPDQPCQSSLKRSGWWESRWEVSTGELQGQVPGCALNVSGERISRSQVPPRSKVAILLRKGPGLCDLHITLQKST